MKRVGWLGAILALAIPLAACAQASRGVSDTDAIMAARQDSNAGIAAHDGARATAAHTRDARIFTSGGKLVEGRDAMRVAFEAAFRNPEFDRFVRSPTEVTIGETDVAAELGKWVGIWRLDGAERTISGSYLASWQKIDGRWQIIAEQYVPLACGGIWKPGDNACGARASLQGGKPR